MHDANVLLQQQNQLLEMMVKRQPVTIVLNRLLLEIENGIPGLYCSVIALDETGKRLRPLSAPSLPPAFTDQLSGLEIGPHAGSCGTAMYRGEPVVVTDIEQDPLWAEYKHLALEHGLRSCWSLPIRLGEHEPVMGSLAMYYPEVKAPDPKHWERLEVGMHLVALVLDRERTDLQLQSYQLNLEHKVEERTYELRSALENLQKTQAILIQREKLANLGALVAGVVHELNTPIGNAVLSVSYMRDCLQQMVLKISNHTLSRHEFMEFVDEVQQATDLVLRNIEKAADLIGSFKQMAIDQSSERRRACPLRHVIEDNLTIFKATIKGVAIDYDVQVHPQDLVIEGYPGVLGQVLTNMLVNARLHAFADRSRGNIKIQAKLVDDHKIKLTFADDGCGIADEHRSKIFDPFYTTKVGQGGSGVGLFLVYKLVTSRLKGSIDVESMPGCGTAFHLEFPRCVDDSVQV
ncbi:MAG: GAF domain-containing protein [Pseudomonadales bacterium]|nr:GAF domain-containing protein [Pseudomonadales bacterium]